MSATAPEGAATRRVYKAYCQRFNVLALYGLSNATNAFIWICFAPIVAQVRERYSVGDFAVNFLSLIFMILYAPGTFLATYVIDRYGLRVCLIVGAALNMVSAWVRYASAFIADPHAAFAVLMLGQALGGIAQPIFTNLPSRIAGDWFPVSERDLATVVGAMTNPLGNAAGSVVPSVIVSVAGDIPSLLLYQGIWSSVLAVAVLLFVKDQPPTPPSAGAELKLKAIEEEDESLELSGSTSLNAGTLAIEGPAEATAFLLDDKIAADVRRVASSSPRAARRHDTSWALHHMLHDYRTLLRNRNYLRLLCAFGIGLGVFNALLTLLAQMLGPCGYGSDTAGIAGGVLLGAGLLGAVVMGVLLEKTKAYVPLLKAGIVLVVGTTIFMLVSLKPGNSAQAIASWGVMGLALIPLLPVSLENAAEATYPIPEDNSAGLLLLVGQLFGIAFIFLLTYLLSINPSADCSSVVSPVAGVIVGSLVIAAGALLTFKKDYRRQRAESLRLQQADGAEGPAAA